MTGGRTGQMELSITVLEGRELWWRECLHHQPIILLRSTKLDPPSQLSPEPSSTKPDLRSGAMVVGFVMVGVSMDIVPGAGVLVVVVVLSACVEINLVGDCRAVVLVSANSRAIPSGAVVARTILLGST